LDIPNLVGLAAGFLTTVAFVPQAARIWKAKSARDISLPAFGSFALGVLLWLAYGLLRGELPIILWNAVTLVLAVAILAMKVRFG
jgi:MtN3 and saliva related transmembrane protein